MQKGPVQRILFFRRQFFFKFKKGILDMKFKLQGHVSLENESVTVTKI